MKMRPLYIVGNWKMNQSLQEIKNFFLEMTKIKMELKCKTWIAPQFIHIPILKDLAFTTGMISIGAQNCHQMDSGAYTGEVSAQSLADMGVDFVILGHSERRAIYKETSELLNQKVQNALKHNLKVIYCVGETLDERTSGQTFNVIEEQLQIGLNSIPLQSQGQVIIAYEPVWAIGTGKVATPEEAEEVHQFIRKKLPFNNPSDTIILYGGSVKPDNIQEILKKENIDGTLVGGASLKAQDFKMLCTSASVLM